MVHFHNGTKAEDYVTLVESEVIPEVNEDIDLNEIPNKRKKIGEKSRWTGNVTILRIIKILFVLSLVTMVAALSYRAYIQDTEIQSLKNKHSASEQHTWGRGKLVNGTSLCDFSVSDFQYAYYRRDHRERTRKFEELSGSACVDACLYIREFDTAINGVTVFVDPAKKGCWCQRNMTSIKTRYQSCFLNSNDTSKNKVQRKDTASAYKCEFKPGDGAGGTEVKIGNQKGNACISACLHLKQFDNTVNGVCVYADSTRGGCWCEKGMTSMHSSSRYRTCTLMPRDQSTKRIDSRVCNFSIGYASGGRKFSIEKQTGPQCIEDCLHMKRVDPSINGVTIIPKEGTCSCNKGMLNITSRYKSCFLQRHNEMCAEKNVSFHGNDIKNITKVDSWIHCSDLCRALPECRFWTWNASTEYCFLKSSDSGRVASFSLNLISGSHECGVDICNFTTGSGASGRRRKISYTRGKACVEDCLRLKDPSVNGVTMYSDPSKIGCFCEYNMTKIDGIYRTCFLKPVTLEPLVHFNDTQPACDLQPGDGYGYGGTEIYLGGLERDVCFKACLHLKKIDNSVNGMTVYSNASRAGCWCEKRMRGVRTSRLYKTCKFKYNDTNNASNTTSVCKFSDGAGDGSGRTRGTSMGRLGRAECFVSCSHMRRIDPSLNGITWDKITNSCYCQRNMTRMGEYKTCFLKS